MKPGLIILCLLAVLPGLSRAEAPANWNTNCTATLTHMAEHPEPVLIFFTASWCGPCKLMSRLTLTNTAVVEALKAFSPVAADIDEHQSLATQYSIDAVPTFVLVATNGTEIRRTTGFQPPDVFLQWLTNGMADLEETLARQAAARQKLADIDRELAAANSPAKATALEIFQMCADRDEQLVQEAAQRLKILATRQPALVLEGLNDPQLATRIQVANVLRTQLGEDFTVDPWGEASARSHQVQAWKNRLTQTTTRP